ncbi:hypothetical protein C440_11703 [Haloferax mucosum ATCC BAA-1512]|uniref:PDGLE domain-containing protein n=1 Tax=Haloferax mucosum ATCC BAA-1512 TaxID=662479 RepID=M0IFP3_9EURY|nr:PDGLE domain-containing protein [Haloferax mucosum]ELZ94284.1 hypothetical protein C440_11703 [Haloferax mucosum ATCC BAA-1512]
MSTERHTTDGWDGQALAGLGALVVAAPVFAWAAAQVGYAEPLDVAAEMTGASASALSLHAGLFPDYTVPGLDPYVGTFVSALVGTLLCLGVALRIGSALE